MKIQHILIGLVIFVLLAPSVMAASNDDQPINFAGDENKESSSSSTLNMDVWGIQQSDMKPSDYVNIDHLTGIASGITPLKNASLLSIAIAFLLAFVSTIIAILICLAIAGYGAIHPNDIKSMKIITTQRQKILALGSVFILCFFMIICTFFFLAMFSKMNWFAA